MLDRPTLTRELVGLDALLSLDCFWARNSRQESRTLLRHFHARSAAILHAEIMIRAKDRG